ncbi:MAG: Wzz/FepE/Etk N-terminal domain-containing protein, partial [Candidatus Omnitrophota bacterium]
MNETFLSSMHMPLRYLKIFFRRKWLLAIPLMIGLIGGIIVGAILPKVYESSSVVLVEEEKTLNPLIEGIAIATDINSRMRTIREQILGWNSLVQLVDRLNLAKDVKSQIDYEKLIADLRDKVMVRMKGPNIIRIAYTNRDPQQAMKVVQTVNSIFVEENMKAQTRESTVAIEFLKDQITVYRRKIKQAEMAEVEDRLKDLLIDATESHPMVKDFRMKLVQLEGELDSKEFDPERAQPITGANPIYEKLVKERLEDVSRQVSPDAPAAKALVSLNEINPSSSGSDESLYKLLLLDKLDSTMAQDAKVNESI